VRVHIYMFVCVCACVCAWYAHALGEQLFAFMHVVLLGYLHIFMHRLQGLTGALKAHPAIEPRFPNWHRAARYKGPQLRL
jgi:hypothetical protein